MSKLIILLLPMAIFGLPPIQEKDLESVSRIAKYYRVTVPKVFGIGGPEVLPILP